MLHFGVVYTSLPLALVLLYLSGAQSAPSLGTVMDASGRILPLTTRDDLPGVGIVTIVTSPGVPSILVPEEVDDASANANAMVSVELESGRLVCPGCTIRSTPSLTERDVQPYGLAVCGAVSNVVIVEGITVGDVEAGLRHTRHARTLSTLFHVRIVAAAAAADSTTAHGGSTKQVLMLAVSGATTGSEWDDDAIVAQVQALFQAASVGSNRNFEDLYDVRIVSVSSSNASELLSMATETAQSVTPENSSTLSLSSTLQSALQQVKGEWSSQLMANPVEAPHITEATLLVSTSALQHTRTMQSHFTAWKNRIARGLLVDGFGVAATNLRQRLVTMYDSETLSAAGLPTVSAYRKERRLQLQQAIDAAIQQAFAGQVSNLEKVTLKRFNAELLKTVLSKDSVETVTGHNAATMRKEALLFETALEKLEVSSLGLTKDKASRDMSSKLNDALDAFPDSPAAKLKRTLAVKKVVNKEKTPGQRSVSLGLDLVAMLRPDGFGSLQGYAGYQLPGGNSITFGVHNDADDPQVISQFGGVRPPLLRVQPKLRVEVEM